MNKEQSQRIHARKRLRERFGIAISEEQYAQLVRNIQNSSKATFIRRQSQRVTLWEIEIEKKIMVAVYDKWRKTIVTCFPSSREKDKKQTVN